MSKQLVAESARTTTDVLDSAVLVGSDVRFRSDVERRVIPRTGCAAARMRGGKFERLRYATQRTHPGGGRRERDLHVIVPVSAPATPKQAARDEARARAPEHARGLP